MRWVTAGIGLWIVSCVVAPAHGALQPGTQSHYANSRHTPDGAYSSVQDLSHSTDWGIDEIDIRAVAGISSGLTPGAEYSASYDVGFAVEFAITEEPMEVYLSWLFDAQYWHGSNIEEMISPDVGDYRTDRGTYLLPAGDYSLLAHADAELNSTDDPLVEVRAAYQFSLVPFVTAPSVPEPSSLAGCVVLAVLGTAVAGCRMLRRKGE